MIIDMHCHILPEADDGPRSMDASLQLLREAERQGVTHMIATPHYHPGRYIVDSRMTQEKIGLLRQACRENDINICIYPGQECYWYSGLLDALGNGTALTMNGSRFVLVEFDTQIIYQGIMNAVTSLTGRGYQVIIAHFERYECLYDKEDRIADLRNEGAYLQLNFDTLLQKDGVFRKNRWRRYLQDGLVDFLGSDTHGMDFRPLHIAQAVRWMSRSVDEEIIRKVMEENPSMLIGSN